MLAKRIIVRPSRTFRFNLAATKTFNADFDGDEMNIFLPQDMDARAELSHLFTTKHNIMTSQSTKNVICITQDALLGSFLLTNTDTDLGQAKFFDLCMKGDGWSSNFILKRLEHIRRVRDENGYKFPLYCGKSIFSMMFPITLNYVKKNDVRKDEPVVKIIKGVLVEGALAKSNLGSAHNSLIHVLHKEYGMDKAIDLLNNTQFIANQFLLHHNFSIGIKDCISTIEKETENIAYRCFIEAKDTEANISHERIRELKICSILDKARDMSMKLSKSKLDKDNAFVATVTAGSKGEYFNIAQITSMLGQQMHMNKRIQKTLNRGKRTLPHYPLKDMTIEQEFESQGFIKHSFLHGLNPQEFIWHATSGREGCSDTAMKSVTWETPIVIIENGEPIYIEIGKWIDALLDIRKDNIVHYSDRNMEMLDVNHIYIPTTDEHGKVTWGEVTAVTRHDPGQQLYQIKTKSGRSVTVTESKSLLIWNKNKKCFEDVLTPEIVIGDFVPVTAELCTPPIVKTSICFNEVIFDATEENGYSIGASFCFSNMKYIPSDFFITTTQFIRGFLKGYLSSTKQIKSNHKRFIEGMNMLFSRINVYGSINENPSEKTYELIMSFTENLVNNVVLDEIIEINLIDVKNHPKVYDLTIPSTLNFGLANGLQVRDTANSGYIQRKMVKVLEDIQVKYDGTVRNTNGWVVQWAYGNDGFDRSECSFNADGDVFFADTARIADRLNNEFELSQ